MAGYSARQSTFTTGDTILAAHSNDEFNQLLAAFNATTGHTHDGTAGEGGPVTSIRDGDSLNKVLVDSTNNHLEFYVEVSSAAVQQLRIQDGGIIPITTNDIDLGTSSLQFKDAFFDGTIETDALTLNGTNITSTATELNIMDGNTVASAITPVDADRVVLNDGGTMRQVTLTKLATYFDDEITNMPNLANIGTDLKVEGEISSSGGFIGGATQNTGSFDFPGAIVGNNVQGLNVAYASYTLTTTMAVPDAGLNVCFVAPKSGIVEIEVQIRADGGSSGTGDLLVGLSDNATYNAVQTYYEQNVIGFPRFDHMHLVHKWIVPSLTPGTKYQ